MSDQTLRATFAIGEPYFLAPRKTTRQGYGGIGDERRKDKRGEPDRPRHAVPPTPEAQHPRQETLAE